MAHVVMGRDKRIYRFVQHTRFGRIVFAESREAHAIVDAMTDYVARPWSSANMRSPFCQRRSRSRWRSGRSVFFAFALGAAALFALALFAALRSL